MLYFLFILVAPDLLLKYLKKLFFFFFVILKNTLFELTFFACLIFDHLYMYLKFQYMYLASGIAKVFSVVLDLAMAVE